MTRISYVNTKFVFTFEYNHMIYKGEGGENSDKYVMGRCKRTCNMSKMSNFARKSVSQLLEHGKKQRTTFKLNSIRQLNIPTDLLVAAASTVMGTPQLGFGTMYC